MWYIIYIQRRHHDIYTDVLCQVQQLPQLLSILFAVVLYYACTLFQAFGAPWIIVHVGGKKERFFGSDRMELLANLLGESRNGVCERMCLSSITRISQCVYLLHC